MYYDSEIIFMSVELKYCERCGDIYLRRSGSRMNLCTSCVTAERALGFGPRIPWSGDEGQMCGGATTLVEGGVA